MFTFYFKQSGAARKPFVKAVSEILEAKPKYLGMPSAAYEIDVVYVTKEGNIELNERTDSELVENLIDRLVERGYEAEPVEGWEDEEPAEEAEEAEPTKEAEPAEEAESTEEVEPTEETEPAEEDESTDDEIAMTISMPRSALTDTGLDNLKKLVSAKGGLLRQTFGIENTEIAVNDEAISFPWFGRLEPEELKYASQFISGLCKFANDSKRITSKPREEDNPKFAMRVWMLRMGFGGEDYKGLRKYLLRNLPGDAAFRYGRPDTQVKREASTDGE